MTDRLEAAMAALLMAGALVLAGCGDGDDGNTGGVDCAAVSGEPSIELGTGETTFVPLDDGDPADIICGTQGGYHIWASVRNLTGLEPSNVRVELTQTRDGVVEGSSSFRLNFTEQDYRTGLVAFFGRAFADPTGFDLDASTGATITFKVVATDVCGNTATDQVEVVLRQGEGC